MLGSAAAKKIAIVTQKRIITWRMNGAAAVTTSSRSWEELEYSICKIDISTKSCQIT